MSKTQNASLAQIEDQTALAIEIVAMFHDEVLNVSHLRAASGPKAAAFTVGRSLGCDFQFDAPEFAGQTVPLVRQSGAGFVLTFLPSFKGEATLEGVKLPLARLIETGRALPSAQLAGAFEILLPQGIKTSIDFGDVTLLISGVAAPRKHPVALSFDKRLAKYIAGATAAAALMLGIMSAVPPEAHSISLDKMKAPFVVAELSLKGSDEAHKTEQPTETGDGPALQGSKGGQAEGPEGRAGRQDSQNQKGHIMIKDHGPERGLAINNAAYRGSRAGLVGAIRPDGFTMVVSRGPLISSDYGDRDILDGGLSGPWGDQVGWGGRGDNGPGWGGGGDNPDTMGTGDYNTIKKGGGDNEWKQPTTGTGQPKDKKPKRPDKGELDFGTVVGAEHDKEMIKREIRKHRASFEYCYEKQLVASPSLEGTVTASFTILGNGAVRASTAKGVHPAVSSCVAGVISRIEFAKPTAGSSASVTYPFIFRQSGE